MNDDRADRARPTAPIDADDPDHSEQATEVSRSGPRASSVPVTGPLLVSAKEATRMLGVGRTTLYELIGRGLLHPVHIGRSLRIPVAELERFVDSLRRQDVASS